MENEAFTLGFMKSTVYFSGVKEQIYVLKCKYILQKKNKVHCRIYQGRARSLIYAKKMR